MRALVSRDTTERWLRGGAAVVWGDGPCTVQLFRPRTNLGRTAASLVQHIALHCDSLKVTPPDKVKEERLIRRPTRSWRLSQLCPKPRCLRICIWAFSSIEGIP